MSAPNKPSKRPGIAMPSVDEDRTITAAAKETAAALKAALG